MKIKSLLLLSAVFAATAQMVTASDLTSVITFKGAAPAERELTPIKDDPNCAAMYPNGVPKTKFYIVGANGELADVLVSLKGVSGKSTGASAAPATLDQKGALYTPQIVAIQTGQKLIVKNSDPVVHNIHTKPTANPESNQVQMSGGADGKFTIKNVPPGKYTLEAAHRKLGTQTAEIEVKVGGATQDFTFEKK